MMHPRTICERRRARSNACLTAPPTGAILAAPAMLLWPLGLQCQEWSCVPRSIQESDRLMPQIDIPQDRPEWDCASAARRRAARADVL